jgi:rhamnosyltransferase
MKNTNISIGIAVLTYNSKHHLPHCLPPLLNSPLKPTVLVVDPDSKDGTPEFAESLGAKVLKIPYREFNHGLTREKARKVLGTDIVLFMTPDAYPKDNLFLEKLIKQITVTGADLAYVRQLPKQGSSPFEALPRLINYPETSHVRSWNERNKWGSFLFFFSDSCGAYRNAALDRIGGFKECILGEDTLACAKILEQGGKVAYVAEAEVYHSHTYSLLQEFRRYFDTGLAREDLKPYLDQVGNDSEYGRSFAKIFLKQLSWKEIPYGVVQLGMKWLGYMTGKTVGKKLPLKIKKMLSSQKFYWTSLAFEEKTR